MTLRQRARPLVGWLLGATLVLPAAGTTSRDRGFCSAWLDLSTAERRDVVARAQPSAGEAASACRSGLAAGVRRKVDAECANWPKLMDFEVRLIVEGVWSACHPDDEGPG